MRTAGLILAAFVVGIVVGYALHTALAPAATQTTTVTQVTATTQTTTVTERQTVTQTETRSPVTVTQTVTVTQPPTTAQAEMRVLASASVLVNGTRGGAVTLYPLVVVIPPGTYVNTTKGVVTVYNFTVVLLTSPTPSAPDGHKTALAFAYMVDGVSSSQYLFVDKDGRPRPLITVALVPAQWTTWAYAGYEVRGNVWVGGRYLFENRWIRAGPWLVNLQFVRPVAWVFAERDTPWPEAQRVEIIRAQPSHGLVPVAAATIRINATQGGAAALGNILAVVQPDTYLDNGTALLSLYNFSLIYYSANVTGIQGLKPLAAYAFAAEGKVTPRYAFVDKNKAPMPVITIAMWPPGTTSWTWLGTTPVVNANETITTGNYRFPNAWIQTGAFLVNLQFFRPVPWIFLAG